MVGADASAELKKNQPTRGKNGGARPGAGRKPGKSTAPLREIARKYMEKAVATLVAVMDDQAAPASARVAASSAMLDRGYGKAPQPIDGDGEGGPIVVEIIRLAD